MKMIRSTSMTSTRGVMFMSAIVSDSGRAAAKAMARLLPGWSISFYARGGAARKQKKRRPEAALLQGAGSEALLARFHESDLFHAGVLGPRKDLGQHFILRVDVGFDLQRRLDRAFGLDLKRRLQHRKRNRRVVPGDGAA